MDVLRNRRVRRFLLGSSLIGLLVGIELLNLLSYEYTIIAFLFLGLLYLDVLEEQTLSITDVVEDIDDKSRAMDGNIEDIRKRASKIGDDLNPVSVFTHEDSLAPELQTVVSESDPDHVFLLDYSSKKGEYIVDAARKTGADVFLLIKNPDEAVRNYQRERIVGQLTHSLFAMFDDYEKLHVGLYNETGAVRARLVGNECICVGWYRYERIGNGSREKIWGHNNPAFYLTEDDQAFDAVDRWLREDVLVTHWENSVGVSELFESGDVPELDRWVYDESETEQETEKKIEYIEEISGAAEKAQQVLLS